MAVFRRSGSAQEEYVILPWAFNPDIGFGSSSRVFSGRKAGLVRFIWHLSSLLSIFLIVLSAFLSFKQDSFVLDAVGGFVKDADLEDSWTYLLAPIMGASFFLFLVSANVGKSAKARVSSGDSHLDKDLSLRYHLTLFLCFLSLSFAACACLAHQTTSSPPLFLGIICVMSVSFAQLYVFFKIKYLNN